MAKKRIDYNLAKQAAGNAALTEQILSPNTSSKNVIKNILISELKNNPYQPRIGMDKNQLEELALSIEQEGLLQPIIVTPNEEGTYYIVAGHRRTEAHKLLNKEHIEAIIHQKVSHAQLAIIPIIENLQRDEMDPIENAIAFKRVLDEKIFISQIELANKISVSKSWMSKMLSILKLPDEVLRMVKQAKFRDISVLTALNTLDETEIINAYNTIKEMSREDALEHISSLKKKNNAIDKAKVVISKHKITIHTKNIDKDKENKIKDLVLQIETILE